MPGTFVGVAVWLIATAVFRLYLSYFGAYGKTYGSLGAVIILMLGCIFRAPRSSSAE